MDLLTTIHELQDHLKDLYWTLEGFDSNPDLKCYQLQDTEMKSLPEEYVYQTGNCDYGFSGIIYFKTEYPDGDGGKLYLKISFNG